MLKTVRGKPEMFGQTGDDLQLLDKFINLLDGTVFAAKFFRVSYSGCSVRVLSVMCDTDYSANWVSTTWARTVSTKTSMTWSLFAPIGCCVKSSRLASSPSLLRYLSSRLLSSPTPLTDYRE